MELALPITVYWDLAPQVALDDSLLQVCDEILECRPLMLQLYDPSHLLGEGVRALLERFRDTPVSVSLTVSPSCLSSPGCQSAADLGVKEILLAISSLEALGPLTGRPGTGISFSVSHDNWRQLPQVVAVCRQRGFSRLVLPMQRLFSGGEAFLLNKSEQSILEQALAEGGGVEGVPLTIHDPFLWRAFNPGIPFPQGGCQAANTMIAIAPDGGVYPCPTLPHRIGRLGTTTLKEIIASAEKKVLRNRILSYPAACNECPEIVVCRGGCRGRSFNRQGSFDAIDEACR